MDSSGLPICQDILALIHLFKTRIAEIAETYGMTGVQFGALYKIAEKEAPTMGQVAQVLHCDASNATGIVDRLVALELVTRRENPQDRRMKMLEATEQGYHIIEEIKAVLPERLGCNLLSQSERRTIHSIAVKMVVK
jgi:DNA-binding MarR family transcriptional regulator